MVNLMLLEELTNVKEQQIPMFTDSSHVPGIGAYLRMANHLYCKTLSL